MDVADATPLHPTQGNVDDVSDVMLVVRAQADRAAFAALFERYWEPVFAYCRYRLPSWEDAEDAANEVFLAALSALPAYRPRGQGFRSWLFGIAHNRVVGHQRRLRIRLTLPFIHALVAADPAPPFDERVADDDEWARTLVMLARLPETERRVCELRLAGLTFEEIAVVLGKRHEAVRKAESRAEARLRRLLLPLGAAGKEAGRGA
jgi:RNA polymerase sigma-70 factor (ECF subfamily)